MDGANPVGTRRSPDGRGCVQYRVLARRLWRHLRHLPRRGVGETRTRPRRAARAGAGLGCMPEAQACQGAAAAFRAGRRRPAGGRSHPPGRRGGEGGRSLSAVPASGCVCPARVGRAGAAGAPGHGGLDADDRPLAAGGGTSSPRLSGRRAGKRGLAWNRRAGPRPPLAGGGGPSPDGPLAAPAAGRRPPDPQAVVLALALGGPVASRRTGGRQPRRGGEKPPTGAAHSDSPPLPGGHGAAAPARPGSGRRRRAPGAGRRALEFRNPALADPASAGPLPGSRSPALGAPACVAAGPPDSWPGPSASGRPFPRRPPQLPPDEVWRSRMAVRPLRHVPLGGLRRCTGGPTGGPRRGAGALRPQNSGTAGLLSHLSRSFRPRPPRGRAARPASPRGASIAAPTLRRADPVLVPEVGEARGAGPYPLGEAGPGPASPGPEGWAPPAVGDGRRRALIRLPVRGAGPADDPLPFLPRIPPGAGPGGCPDGAASGSQ